MNIVNRLAFASALAVSIVYSILTLLHVVLPEHILNLYTKVHHLKTLAPLQSEVTISSYLVGLVFKFVVVYLVVWLAGMIYEALTRNYVVENGTYNNRRNY